MLYATAHRLWYKCREGIPRKTHWLLKGLIVWEQHPTLTCLVHLQSLN